MSPQYIADLLVLYVPTRALRSAGQNLLAEKRVSLKRTGERAYSFAAAKLWNQLPATLRACDNLNDFKRMLKTHLFREAFIDS